jgi:hypothetical protein
VEQNKTVQIDGGHNVQGRTSEEANCYRSVYQQSVLARKPRAIRSGAFPLHQNDKGGNSLGGAYTRRGKVLSQRFSRRGVLARRQSAIATEQNRPNCRFCSAQEVDPSFFQGGSTRAKNSIQARRAECTATKKPKDQDHSFFEVKPETVRDMCSRALLAGVPWVSRVRPHQGGPGSTLF